MSIHGLSKPVIALAMGDPAGISPELTALMGFDRGVTLLGGFPFPICTPAHGTAYDIAGRGIASIGASRAALLLAAEMAGASARSRKQYS
jgi:4-hydroxy-L-threonine phosphate dehydrogenase PdxA